MKKTIAMLLLLNIGLAASANAQWPQTTAHNPWSLEIGGMALERPGTGEGDALISNSVTGEVLFDTNDATDLGTAPAAEVKFNFHSQTGQEWEFRTILANWSQSSGPFFGPDLTSPFFPAGFVPDQFDFNHDSDLYSFELMKRKAVHPGWVLMCGPRVVSTKDSMVLNSQLEVSPGPGIPSILTTAQSFTEATNVLIGLQGGLEINRPVTDAIYGNGFCRVGGYYNPTQVNRVDTIELIGTTTSQLDHSTGSFLGEVGGRVYVDFVPNCFSGYVGYEANWIDGIAIAPAQFSSATTTPTSVDTANTVFFQGVTFGLRYTY